jgi:hypothetical protein
MNALRPPVLALLALLLLATGPATAQVVLAEMLADPDSDWNGDGDVHFRDDEWIEVQNVSGGTIDLADYIVRDVLGDDPHLQLSGVLAPGAVAVFYGSDAVAWQQENGYSITGLSLNNGGDVVELLFLDPELPDPVLVDQYQYAEHEAVDDRASGRLPDTGEWALFDALNPYDGDVPPLGTGCGPTPAIANDCVPLVPNDGATWGMVKQLYR